MLTRNHKYTAAEILAAAGISEIILPAATEGAEPEVVAGEAIFERFSVNIGGISGITEPGRVILVSPGTEKLFVQVAGQTKEVELGEEYPEEQAISEGARVSLDEAGHAANPVEEAPAESVEAPAEEEQKVEVRVESEQPAG